GAGTVRGSTRAVRGGAELRLAGAAGPVPGADPVRGPAAVRGQPSLRGRPRILPLHAAREQDDAVPPAPGPPGPHHGRPGGGLEQDRDYVEHAQSRSLQELLLGAAAPVAPVAAGKSELVRRVSDLREELNWYYHRIESEQMSAEERTEQRVQALQDQVVARESELMRVIRELPASESESLELLAPVSLGLDEVRRALPQDA